MNRQNNRNILWAEDNDIVFDRAKMLLDNYLSSRNIFAQIDRAIDGNEVFRLLGNKSYDIVILDLDMPHYNGLLTIENVAKHWGELSQVVISGHIEEQPYKEHIEKLLKKGIVKGYFETRDEVSWCKFIFELLEITPLSIIHFSDIHFGKYHAFNPGLKLMDVLRNIIPEIKKKYKPNLLIISGDLTSEALDEEFDLSSEFIHSLSDYLGININQTIIVPGNHDINRMAPKNRRFDNFIEFMNTCFLSSIDGLEVLKRFPVLYNEEHKKLIWDRKKNKPEDLYSINSIKSGKGTIVGFNSVIIDDKNFDKGEIPLKQLLLVKNKCEDIYKKNNLKIAVFHHHLFPIPSIVADLEDRTLSNQAIVMKQLIEMEFKFVIHGHSHYPAGYLFSPLFYKDIQKDDPLYIFSTGTLGGNHFNKASSYFHFNVLKYELNKVNEYTRLKVIPYTLNLDSLSWHSGEEINLKLVTM